MLKCQHHHNIFLIHTPSLTPPLHSKPTSAFSLPPHPRPRPGPCLAQSPESTTNTSITPKTTTTISTLEEGPIELPPSTPSIFASTDDSSPLQVASSLLLTGAISVFLFRSLRRRAKRAKELKFRSSGAKKSLKEEALDSLKAMGSAPVGANAPPSPVQALLGGISAGVIALILYKFTTNIEEALNRQTISENFSVLSLIPFSSLCCTLSGTGFC